ncbi:MAG: prevent-host-death family protein [Actinobacteria bacterium]|nr:prevent-host-death family protein [Actinomycetota bacterium]
MASRIGIRDLRDHLTSTIRRVRQGETFEITHEKIPVAVLAPIRRGRIERLISAGDVRAGTPLTVPVRRFPATSEIGASEALEDDRAGI